MLKAEQREAEDGGTGVFDGVQSSRGTKPWLLTTSVSRNSLRSSRSASGGRGGARRQCLEAVDLKTIVPPHNTVTYTEV